MNRKVLFVALLGIAAFVATWLILDELDDFKTAPRDKTPAIPTGRGEMEPWRSGDRSETARKTGDPVETGPESAGDPAEEILAPGAIKATVVDEEGAAVRDFALDLRPFAGRVSSNSGGLLEIEDVPQGKYRLSVWAKGKVRQDLISVEVKAGRETGLEFKLKSGFRPRGIVIDEKSKAPVAGVTIAFAGGGRCLSESDGHFMATYDLAPGCLDVITVSHPDYDRYTYHRMVIPDHQNIMLGMTRGDSVIKGRILNKSGRTLPSHYRLRLWMERGLNIPPEVRKERLFKPSETFKFEGVHRGLYQLMLEFPESNLVARHVTLEIGFRDTKEIEFVVSGGVKLTGRVISRARTSLVTKLELINKNNLIAATIHCNEKGEFTFDGVEPGTWRIRAWRGSPIIDYPSIEVATANLRLELDVDRQKMKVVAQVK